MNARIPMSVTPGDSAGLPPGAARCPGPSVQDIVARDAMPAPAILREEHYAFLGDQDIGYDRYTSPQHFEREMTHIWARTWQWACREEHIPQTGDYYVYEIGPHSVIVVRTEDGIKAYHNACLHRGTKLRFDEGMGSATELRCPFHGWTWQLDGRLKSVPCAWDFPHVQPDAYRLPEVRTGQWGGFVFICLDDDAPPLESYLEVLPEHFRDWDLGRRYTELHMGKILACNWKTALEAFVESYHVLETHPQLLHGTGDANVQYDVYGEHVTRFYAAGGVNSPHVEQPLSEQELVDTMLIGDRSVVDDALVVGAGETARTVMARFLRKTLGGKYRCDLSQVSDAEMIDTIEYHLFPNMILFPGVSLPMVYRFRPLGMEPERCLFEILFLRPLPDDGLPPDPPEMARVGEDESYSVVPGLDPLLARVYDQDTGNLRAQQKGFRISRKRGQTLGNYQEVRIRHFERTVDRYLARAASGQ
ncbi:aromatic ring-hydroxylating oxygenase subunit alpha [Thauera linaloolentis]|uniref:Rieske (2Fe-2S) domain-containing protein n=1 Tax=Thauera linaloolentis (strain DSM 12138 / JCM 21573 / CCUG 41526 / CIP 105981 / IAM 15112 / NBRC 102519 / 47Lol) TaxID=1123367 RepID=N6YTQ2_THAL4|nr:aromatic ring-hydroxylating dioxygenase subunit alpha [Thauera linaloolentis]ENO85558.1 Rieske (2Fe-2S) domain-containing protein [Thauera linaloolentis 47Lol = DSM 12138]MCM8566546.1 aromatic ring-hydroxylating dioxygenase subunit alpha [Thauera linaloolentis]